MTDPTSAMIRPATVDDMPQVLGLIQELADYEKMSDEVIATVADLEQTLFGPAQSAACLVATVEDRVVGMAIFFTNYSTFLAKPGLYLEDLYVQPAFRGKGIGKGLLTAVAKQAVTRNCGRMEWSVLDWNQPAIDFYESLGARPMSGWTVYRLTGDALQQVGGGPAQS